MGKANKNIKHLRHQILWLLQEAIKIKKTGSEEKQTLLEYNSNCQEQFSSKKQNLEIKASNNGNKQQNKA